MPRHLQHPGGAPTIYDVAETAGVSIATVSRVLADSAAVRPKTRERVLAAIRELAYIPRGSARTLAARKNSALGLFLPGFDEIDLQPRPETRDEVRVIDDTAGGAAPVRGTGYFQQVLHGAELEAWTQGFALLVAIGRGEAATESLSDMASRVDGMVVLGAVADQAVLTRLAQRVPVVLAAGAGSNPELDHVYVDNAGGMRSLTQHVRSTTRPTVISFISGSVDSPDNADRLRGFRDATADLPADRVIITEAGEFSEARGLEIGRSLIERDRLGDAVLCANDQLALGLLRACAAAGLRVPTDVVVTGFDGLEAGNASIPRLTSVRQPMLDLGRHAVSLLGDRVGEPNRKPVTRRLGVDILLRQTTDRFPGDDAATVNR